MSQNIIHVKVIYIFLSFFIGNMSKQQLDSGDAGEESSDAEETVLPPTYIVVQISSDIPEKTLTWVIDKIRGRKRDGGGELIVMKQPCNPEDVSIISVLVIRY